MPNRAAFILFSAILAVPASAMTLSVSNWSGSPKTAVPVVDEYGSYVADNTGWVAAGTFDSFSDEEISAAASNPESMQRALNDFRQNGKSNDFGVGSLHRDGFFSLGSSAATNPGDGLVGKSIFIIGGTASGIFVYKSGQTWLADYPVAFGELRIGKMDAQTVGSGLLVGSVGDGGESSHGFTVTSTIVLQAMAGSTLNVSRFTDSIDRPPPPVSIPPVLPPSADVVENKGSEEPPTTVTPPTTEVQPPIQPPVAVETPPIVANPGDPVDIDPGFYQRDIDVFTEWPSVGMVYDSSRIIRLVKSSSGGYILQTSDLGFSEFDGNQFAVTSLGLKGPVATGYRSNIAVPEPSSLFLSLVGVALARRRR